MRRRWSVLTVGRVAAARADSERIAAVGSLEARQVVVATGPFHVPFIPLIADGPDLGVYQIHSAGYQHPTSPT